MSDLVLPLAMFAPGAACLGLAMIGDALPATRYTRNGGMRFLRIGRVQMSWCVCRSSLSRGEG